MLSPFQDTDNGGDDLIELKLSETYQIVKTAVDNLPSITAVAGIVDELAALPAMVADVSAAAVSAAAAAGGVTAAKDAALVDITAASAGALGDLSVASVGALDDITAASAAAIDDLIAAEAGETARNLALSLAIPQRLLNRRIMASPPVITYSASDPGTGWTLCQAADGVHPSGFFSYRKMSKVVASNSLIYDAGASPGLVAGVPSYSGHTAAVAFLYDGSGLHLHLQNNGQKIWIKVDGEYVSLTPTILGNDQAWGYTHVPFGSPKMREIEVIVSGVGSQFRFAGIMAEKTATVAPVAARGKKLLVFGDSFAEGAGTTNGINSFVPVLADALGWDDVITSAVGGTGLIANALGTKLTYRQRAATDVIAHAPDVVLIQGSTNDGTQTGAAVSAELQALIGDIRTALPNTKIIVTSMMVGAGGGFIPPSAYLAADGFRAAAAAAGVPFINLLEQRLPAQPAVLAGATTRVAAISATRLYTNVQMKKGQTIKFADGTHCRVTLGTPSGTGDFICDVDRCYAGLGIGATFTVVGNSLWSGNGRVGSTNGTGNCDKVVSSDGIHPSEDGGIMIGTALANEMIPALIATI